MRIPKYLKLQNRQLRRLSAKGASSVTTFLNTPFVLWLLTAIFVTIGSSYFSSRQACLLNARIDATTYRQLSDEIYQRRRRIIQAAYSSSNSIDFKRLALDRSFATFKTFDGQTLSSLLYQLGDLNHKIDGIREIYDQAQNARDEFALDIGPVEDLLYGNDALVYDKDIIHFRPYGERMMFVFMGQRLALWSRDLVPNCSPSSLIHDLFSDVPSRHIRFTRNLEMRTIR